MGLFSSKKKIFVSSVVYNMAGDEKDRPQYLQSLVLRNVLSNSSDTLGDAIRLGYLGGPGIKYRTFFRWADREFDLIGMPTSTLQTVATIGTSLLEGRIPVAAGNSTWVQKAEADDADFFRWAEQYFLENHPDLIETEWAADFNDATGEIVITFEDETTATFFPHNFHRESKYIFAYYNEVSGEEIGPRETGVDEVLDPGDPFPDMADWEELTNTSTTETVELTTSVQTVVTYSDARPPEASSVVTQEDEDITLVEASYTRTDFMGQEDSEEVDVLYSTRQFAYHTEGYTVEETETEVVTEEEIVEGTTTITVTTTVTTIVETLVRVRTVRVDQEQISHQGWSPLKLWIYRVGSGIAALDNVVQEVDNYAQFYPFIPVRLDNKFLGPDFYPTEYDICSRAYRKITSNRFHKLIESIEDNPSIRDIDYAYVVFGVSINVIENACREYMWRFFDSLAENQINGASAYDDYIAAELAYVEAKDEWLEWKDAQTVTYTGSENNPRPVYKPGYGDPEPELPERVSMPTNTLQVNNSGSLPTNYDVRVSWSFVQKSAVMTGKGRPNAKSKSLWFTVEGSDEVIAGIYNRKNQQDIDESGINNPPSGDNEGFRLLFPRITFDNKTIEKVRLWKQLDENTYQYFDIVGLIHRNYIYQGHFVETTAKAGIEDGEESGFIIPLHHGIYRAMPLVEATQMATASLFIVFNCYEVKKVRWYQRGIFKILLVIVIAIVSVAFTGGAGIGLLGSHAAVGGALGLSGMSAAIAGAVANAIAALVLTTLIETVAIKVFGSKFGALIGAVLSFVAFTSIMNFHQTGSFALNWGDMMKADNLLKLSDALGRGYTGYVGARIEEIQAEMNEFKEDADKELKRIADAYQQQFGGTNVDFDPMILTGYASVKQRVRSELPDSFLSRTLMTGGDIANMSLEMLNNFADMSLILPDAFST